MAIVICSAMVCCKQLLAKEPPPPDIVITGQEIASTSDNIAVQGKDYYTIDSEMDDVRRIQGEPDDKFFDGRYKVWYYGKDAVYFNYYGKVVGAENKSGNLKFR